MFVAPRAGSRASIDAEGRATREAHTFLGLAVSRYSTMMLQIVLVAAALVVSYLGTGLIRRLAIARSWLDVPNQRSSHSAPTPRGGGIAIATVFVVACGAGTLLGWIPRTLASALILGGVPIALIGWIDDRWNTSVRVRMVVHMAAATYAVWVLRGLPELRLGSATIAMGAFGFVLAVVFVVWCVNLYNFMDGIDGIAGAEAVCVALIGGACATSAPGVTLMAYVLAGCSLGFLFWNWEPARIFLGDVGSGFLGYVIATLALASERGNGLPLVLWVVLLGAFAFDATLTLIRRRLRGERLSTPHKRHAYQRLVASGLAHRRVVGSLMALNVLLGGLTVIAWRHPSLLALMLMIATLSLVVVYLVAERRQSMY